MQKSIFSHRVAMCRGRALFQVLLIVHKKFFSAASLPVCLLLEFSCCVLSGSGLPFFFYFHCFWEILFTFLGYLVFYMVLKVRILSGYTDIGHHLLFTYPDIDFILLYRCACFTLCCLTWKFSIDYAGLRLTNSFCSFWSNETEPSWNVFTWCWSASDSLLVDTNAGK